MAFLAMAFQGAGAAEPARIYWVQVAACSTTAEAEQFQQGILGSGYAPVCVYPASTGPSVRVGEFGAYMDAHLLFEDLRARYPESRIRFNSVDEEERAGRKWSFQQLTAPPSSNELFCLSTRPLNSNGLTFRNELCGILEGGTRVAARLPTNAAELRTDALNQLSGAASSDTAQRGSAAMLLADLSAREGGLQEARELALPIANGEQSATAQERYDAMWLMARVYHALDWRRTAYRAYREIESVSHTPVDRARARIEMTALTMELAQSGSGSLEDSRWLCSSFLSKHAERPAPELRSFCATAALMRAECLYLSDDRLAAIEELSRVVEEYSDQPREAAMGLYFLAHTMRREGLAADALNIISSLSDSTDAAVQSNFPGVNLRERALCDLIVLGAELGDQQLTNVRLAEFMAQFPDSPLVENLARRLANSPTADQDSPAYTELLSRLGDFESSR